MYALRFFRANNLLHEHFETRIAAEIVEHWVDFYGKKVVGLMFLVGMFELLDRTIFVTQSYLNQR